MCFLVSLRVQKDFVVFNICFSVAFQVPKDLVVLKICFLDFGMSSLNASAIWVPDCQFGIHLVSGFRNVKFLCGDQDHKNLKKKIPKISNFIKKS